MYFLGIRCYSLARRTRSKLYQYIIRVKEDSGDSEYVKNMLKKFLLGGLDSLPHVPTSERGGEKSGSKHERKSKATKKKPSKQSK